jgi:rhodanese-related sulfurtransferase
MPSSTSVSELAKVLGTARAPLLLDVRPEQAFEAGEHLVAGAIWRSPKQLEQWCDHLPRDRPVLVYCVHGHEVSQGVASTLESNGISASYLAGGFAAWSTQSSAQAQARTGGRRPFNMGYA